MIIYSDENGTAIKVREVIYLGQRYLSDWCMDGVFP